MTQNKGSEAIENPSAFPTSYINRGMTLRDYFAGQALVSMGTWMPPSATGMLNADETLRQRADWAYRHADAMLAARAPGAA